MLRIEPESSHRAAGVLLIDLDIVHMSIATKYQFIILSFLLGFAHLHATISIDSMLMTD